MSTLVGHFVSSRRERETRDRRGDEERDRGERKMNNSKETEEIKTPHFYPYLLQGQQALPNCKPVSVGRHGDVRYTTSLPHQTIPTPMF